MVSDQYFPIIAFLLLALIMGIAMIVVNKIVSRNNPDSSKNSPYECGFEEFEDARMKFDVKYYIIAIIFILFDLEIAFLLPWALVFKKLGLYGLIVMFVFLAILISGFIYIWKKGALEWE
jgi:NADH-quinone oxidoreductase subunit A